MGKGIIIVDIPKSCKECGRYIDGIFGGYGCTVNGKFISVNNSDKKIKPDWCPIKPFPEKKKIINDPVSIPGVYTEGIHDGWNKCIDEILKGETIEENQPHQEQR